MNQYSIIFFTTALFFLHIRPAAADDSYWQCSALDNQEKSWVVISSYERVASTRAFDACKKQSAAPLSCKTPKESCEYFVNGLTTRPMWRCMALDQMSKPWFSNIHSNRDEAAIESKDFCQRHSGMPESCYINLMTCKNLNERG